MKKIFKVIMSISCLLSMVSQMNDTDSRNIKANNKSEELVSFHHLGEENTRSLFNSLIGKQESLFQEDYYSNYYFANLKNNIGNNAYGSCTYVAIGMLLSFYDSYWDDTFIPEAYDKDSLVNTTRPTGADFDLIPLNSESPGIAFEENELVSNLTMEKYLNVVENNSDQYFQFKLIQLAKQQFGDEKFDSSTESLGMNQSELKQFLNYYIYSFIQKRTSDVTINSTTGSTETVKSFTISNILDGTPVLLRAKNSNNNAGHAMIAYDYDDETQEIYVHTGWRDENGKTLTHVSLNDLGYNILSDATVINLNYSYAFASNYIKSDGTRITSANYWIPRNIELVSGNFRDTLPKFTWKGMYKEKWVSSKNPFYILSILDINSRQLFKITNINKREYTLAQGEWNHLLFTDKNDSYQIYVEMSSDTYTYWDDYWTKKSFYKTNKYENFPSITPAEYGFADAYPSDSTTENQFVTHTTSSGFSFQTRRYRTGYIHNEYIVMSPIRTGYKKAFIEYKFDTPISRIDVELSHWRSTSMEELTSDTGIAGVYEYYNDEYIQSLDLLSESTNLPTDRNKPTVYKIMFKNPVYQFRFYSETFNSITSSTNKGRICIGNMTFFPVNYPMPLSGYELDYEPEKWNGKDKTTYNCYAYMLNAKSLGSINPGSSKYGALESIDDYFTKSVLEEMVRIDAKKYGFIFNAIDKYVACRPGCYKVALVLMPNEDFHWYRQNSDGTWSHKYGPSIVRNVDASGKIITDPETCDRYYSRYTNYEEFVGFYEVSPVDQI